MATIKSFTFFTILLVLLILVESDSPDEAPQNENIRAENTLFLPPEIPVVQTRRTKKFKDLIFKSKPVFDELLSKAQKKIVNIAEKVFKLKYNSLPVKKSVIVGGGGDSNEAMEVKAFELLSSIVGRAVRNTLICSTIFGSTSRYGRGCSREGMSILNDNKDEELEKDPLCSSNDEDEDCKENSQQQSGSKSTYSGPALKSIFTIRSTSKPGSISLPTNGDLQQALAQDMWKSESPTKIIFCLLPFEFMKKLDLDRKITHKMASAFQDKYGSSENHNIVVVHWPEIVSKRLSIVQLASRFLKTAHLLARLLVRWDKKKQIKLDKVHIIGASMGAHLAGVVGESVKERISKSIGRITGLDPLGWGFDELDGFGVDPELELTKDDANFVDIIHTSAPDPSFPFVHYGSNEKRGTVDFYPNNGRARYCAPTDGLCHHLYSVVLYIASITGKNFQACKCSSWDNFSIRGRCTPCSESARMGESVDKRQTRGVFYIATA